MTFPMRRSRTSDTSPLSVPRMLRFQLERPHLINRLALLDFRLVHDHSGDHELI